MWILEGKGKQETSNDLNPTVSDTLIFRILKNKNKNKKIKRKEKKERTICLTSNVLVIGNVTCTT